MEFPHSFYEDELICDYFVPSMVKRSWAAQMSILSDLDKACAANGMEYFAEWGTLLGTVRHGGFIPWDDDLDVGMKRKDYDRLMNGISTMLPENYSIVSYRSNRSFNQMLGRLVSSDHYRFDTEYLHQYSGLPIALGLDIFPLDFLTGDEEYEKEREERARLVYGAVNELALYNTPVSAIKNTLSEIEKRCKVTIDRDGDVLTFLRQLLEAIFGEADEKDAKYITLYPIWMDNKEYAFPVEYYQRSIRLPFEMTDIPVPIGYDSILKKKYGAGYLTPVRSGGAHEYPYYEKHVGILRTEFGFEWPKYAFSAADMSRRERPAVGAEGRKAVFVTYSAAAYENMRSLAKLYADEGYDVTVLVARKYDIAPDMTGITPSPSVPDEYYSEGLQNAVISHDLRVLDDRPDVIVTDYPYDEYNLITAVDKEYYSRQLKQRTSWLVYVPPFEPRSIKDEDERAIKLMPEYVHVPAAAVCDEIVLGSAGMKKRYVDCLCLMSGEEYRDRWEEKITVAERKAPARSRSRRRILFHIGAGVFAEHGRAAAEAVRRAYEIFDANSEKAEAVYSLQKGLSENLAGMPGISDELSDLTLRESQWTQDIDDIDAYYGEPSVYAAGLLSEGRPVMIMKP